MALTIVNSASVLLCQFPWLCLPPCMKRRSSSKNFCCTAAYSSNPQSVTNNIKLSQLGQCPEVVKSMEGWIKDNILPILKPVEKSWQPQDFLPEPNSESFYEQVKELRERAKELPDEYYVVLVGDMITEEALPTYQSRLTIRDGVLDKTGVDDTPLAIWSRAWSAEENRHGDLLNKYLFLSGRVDMKQVEKTIQHLIGSGMNNGSGTETYYGLIYTSFQERATFISHGNTARLAKKHGDEKLAQICGTIAADEKRHETAYTNIMGKIFDMDPDNAVMAFADTMRRKVQMPAHLMYDGRDRMLFQNFCDVASRIGVYSATDYVENIEHFVEKWSVKKLQGLSGEGRRAQDYVCGLASRLRKLEERALEQGLLKGKEPRAATFSWIFDKDVQL